MTGCEMPSTKPNGSIAGFFAGIERDPVAARPCRSRRRAAQTSLSSARDVRLVLAVDEQGEVARLAGPTAISPGAFSPVSPRMRPRPSMPIPSRKAGGKPLTHSSGRPSRSSAPGAERDGEHRVAPAACGRRRRRCRGRAPAMKARARRLVVGQVEEQAGAVRHEAEAAEDEALDLAGLELGGGPRTGAEQGQPLRRLVVGQRARPGRGASPRCARTWSVVRSG